MPRKIQGGACILKWTVHSFLLMYLYAFQLRKTYAVIEHIKLHASGFTWDDTRGACIDVASQSAWQTYVKQHPDAKPFRNKGWTHLARMEKLVPSQAKGTHVFRPSQATTLDDQEDDRQSTDPPSPADPPSPPADYGAGPGSPSVWDIERGHGLREDDDEEDAGRSSVRASLFNLFLPIYQNIVSDSIPSASCRRPQTLRCRDPCCAPETSPALWKWAGPRKYCFCCDRFRRNSWGFPRALRIHQHHSPCNSSPTCSCTSGGTSRSSAANADNFSDNSESQACCSHSRTATRDLPRRV